LEVNEAIKRIEEHCDIHKLNEPQAIFISQALDMSIKALKEKQERENPQPLSLEELRQMNGKPVWIIEIEKENQFWEICYGIELFTGWCSETQYLENETMLNAGASRSGLFVKDYEKTWIAYLHETN
jgi:hypothetical protein